MGRLHFPPLCIPASDWHTSRLQDPPAEFKKACLRTKGLLCAPEGSPSRANWKGGYTGHRRQHSGNQSAGTQAKEEHVCLCVLVAQACPTLCDPMDCSLPGSSVHGILQARILEWLTFPSPGGIFPIQGSNPRLPCCKQILYRLSHQGSPERLCTNTRLLAGPVRCVLLPVCLVADDGHGAGLPS